MGIIQPTEWQKELIDNFLTPQSAIEWIGGKVLPLPSAPYQTDKDDLPYDQQPAYIFGNILVREIRAQLQPRRTNGKTFIDSDGSSRKLHTYQDVDRFLVNVYFDVSNTLANTEKTAKVREKIAGILHYINPRQLQNHFAFYYVGANEQIKCGQAIVEHINKTKPQNVVIVTDRDFENLEISTIVKGVVLLALFDGCESTNIKTAIRSRNTRYCEF